MRRRSEAWVIAGLVLLMLSVPLFVGAVLLAGPMADADCSHEDQTDCDQWRAMAAVVGGMGVVSLVGGGVLVATGTTRTARGPDEP